MSTQLPRMLDVTAAAIVGMLIGYAVGHHGCVTVPTAAVQSAGSLKPWGDYGR